MQVGPVSPNGPISSPASNTSVKATATDAFGLGFDSLLKIILTQLTYQDPLKPMDNFQFVSQLAQFSQLQIGQAGNDHLEKMVTAQANTQAATLLGRQVDVPAGSTVLTGKVVSVSFANGEARITLKTSDNQTISNISIGSISQIREGN